MAEKYIGQRHGATTGGSSMERGQKERMEPGTLVGNKSGHETAMGMGTTRKDADISTTTHSAGPLSPGEKGGADDK